MHRILITGSRSWNCAALATRIVNRLVAKYGAANLIIVHGAALGVDLAFDLAAKAAGVAVEPHPADWDNLDMPGALVRQDKNGRAYVANAGPIRNKIMVDLGADLCVVCHKSIKYSKGSRGCAILAIAAGIPTYLIDSDDGEPKRIEEI